MSFYVGVKKFAIVAVDASGVARLTASTASVPPGYYQIQATYDGDVGDNGAQSGIVTVYVKP